MFGPNFPKKGISGLKQKNLTVLNFSARDPTETTAFNCLFSLVAETMSHLLLVAETIKSNLFVC